MQLLGFFQGGEGGIRDVGAGLKVRGVSDCMVSKYTHDAIDMPTVLSYLKGLMGG